MEHRLGSSGGTLAASKSLTSTPMKRSERYAMRARHSFGMGGIVLAAGVAVGCWAPMSVLGEPSGGAVALSTGMGAIALLSVTLSIILIRDGFRFRRIARNEAIWEWRSSIRPRDPSF